MLLVKLSIIGEKERMKWQRMEDILLKSGYQKIDLGEQIDRFHLDKEKVKVPRKLHTKRLFIGFLILGLILTSAVVVIAQLNRSLTNTIVVVGAANIQIYSDGACTTPITSTDWGSMFRGDSLAKTIYLKNTGDVKLYVSWSSVDLPTGLSLILTWNGTPWTSIMDANAGLSYTIAMTLSVSTSTTLGTFSFTTTFVGTT